MVSPLGFLDTDCRFGCANCNPSWFGRFMGSSANPPQLLLLIISNEPDVDHSTKISFHVASRSARQSSSDSTQMTQVSVSQSVVCSLIAKSGLLL